MEVQLLFYTGVFSAVFLTAMMLASKLIEGFRFWPPGKRNISWILYWILSTANLIGIAGLSWLQITPLNNISANLTVGVLICLSGVFITVYAIRNLGMEQTSGVKKNFRVEGLYRHSRNPQVLGNLLSLLGLLIAVQTPKMVILSILSSSWLTAMIFAEEEWLEETYGEEYRKYREEVPRFL